MQISGVQITDHAWDRWCERYPGIVGLRNPDEDLLEQHLKTIFKRAKPEEMQAGARVIRLLNNEAEDAVYLYDKGTHLRFVLSADKTTMITVEEDRHWEKQESRTSKRNFR